MCEIAYVNYQKPNTIVIYIHADAFTLLDKLGAVLKWLPSSNSSHLWSGGSHSYN